MKLFFGILSIIPAAFAYYFYFRDIFAGKTRPHAGIGAWATGLTSIASLSIFCLAVFKGYTSPTRYDWTLLFLALAGFVMLFVIKNKDIAIWITLFALVIGFIMTIRKSFWKPDEETAKSFVLNTIKFIPSIFALSSFSFLTVAYPTVALLGNAAIAMVIYTRREQLDRRGNQ